MKKIALIGAGGKMGCRLTRNLKSSAYQVSYVEISPAGIERLKELGVSVSNGEVVVPDADIVILAVPDVALAKVSANIIPQMKSGALLMTLDPAVARAGRLFLRTDVSYFIAHPSHPSVFNWEPTPEAQADFFGGTLAKQTIVCALMQGPEVDYKLGEAVAKTMYAPVTKAFEITMEQMALLEPALVETLSSSCLDLVREGMEEIIKRGVPAEAAREFLLGHINIQLAVLFKELPNAVFSDAANKALQRGRSILFKEDWKQIFEPDNVLQQVIDIT
ncbi:MAG: semialdehyde dehydrogenase [Bacteroidetes bacterium GWF2_42_66]|nr:MAG: semialdehyde dehydrogenase [Bacteroidetes bacterium GWA2_42_15]OFY00087.1 MAG: semialdehyde dehydrogenase [Bacteroidetes bacterium GWE2_42_39]OFY40230.1 MAG: semialdehyde dehydrogenase [Bacteroidetes bacterium GWF2_42_66]HBL74066.1 semialdehyde dehydrogenase [Prolixibacteraceae bacterium]HCR89787.1 semialdehyde dehydrogenase [Prolixibacteraceae bacterium]